MAIDSHAGQYIPWKSLVTIFLKIGYTNHHFLKLRKGLSSSTFGISISQIGGNDFQGICIMYNV